DPLHKPGLRQIRMSGHAVENILVIIKIQKAHTADKQRNCPSPASLEVGEKLKDIAEPENQEDDGQDVGARPKHKKEAESGVSACATDPIMDREVRRHGVGGNVTTIKGKLRNHQQNSCGDKHNSD